MALPALALPADQPRRFRPTWVIGRTTDLTCLIGGALVAYGLLAAHVSGVAAVTIYGGVLATTACTSSPSRGLHLDQDERIARAGLLRGSLGFFALGPATVGLSALAGRRLPYDLFLTLCTLWAYWHVVRQHYGVMVLYKKKAGDTEPIDDRVDGIFLYVGLLAPIAAFALQNEARCRWSA
jgi:hypothetical protein